MGKINVAMICKLMPLYRLGIFQELSSVTDDYHFDFFGDTIKKGGIEPIPYSYGNAKEGQKINWIRTKNYLYSSDKLLWQTGIIKQIFGSKYKVFVFEGAIGHLPIWLFAMLCRIKKKKVIYWTHGNRGLDRGIKKKMRIVFFKWLGNTIFLYGNYQRNIMIEDGYHPNKLQVIYNSLKPQEQFDTLSEYQKRGFKKSDLNIFKNPDHFTLIFIGRLAESKGIFKILEALITLNKLNIMANCIFIGDGKKKVEMVKICKANNLTDQVHFTGALYDEKDIAPFFMAADMMISPGNVGLNCMHSLAYGVPVLTHDDFRYQNPEVEAIEDGVSGVFYKYGDDNDMILKLKNWIVSDVSKKENISNCQKVIKEIYNPQYQAKCMIAGLNKVLHE